MVIKVSRKMRVRRSQVICIGATANAASHLIVILLSGAPSGRLAVVWVIAIVVHVEAAAGIVAVAGSAASSCLLLVLLVALPGV